MTERACRCIIRKINCSEGAPRGNEDMRPEEKKGTLLPVWAVLLIDLLCLGVALCVFALFHHVLPQQMRPEETHALTAGTPSPSQTPEQQEVVLVPTVTPEAETPTPTPPATQWGAKFQEHFSQGITATDTSYQSSGISVTMHTMEKDTENGHVTYYVADIYLADVKYFRSAFAEDTYGKGYREQLIDMAVRNRAITAMTGDYYGNHSSGIVIRNGEIYRTSDSKYDVCVLYLDGTMETYAGADFDAEAAIARGAWQAWVFGPALLDENGQAATSFKTSSQIKSINPRSALGYYEPGHYCFIAVDGRAGRRSVGVTIEQLAAIMQELGCTAAYNFDGGDSAALTFSGTLVNQPSGGGRALSDCLMICEVADE